MIRIVGLLLALAAIVYADVGSEMARGCQIVFNNYKNELSKSQHAHTTCLRNLDTSVSENRRLQTDLDICRRDNAELNGNRELLDDLRIKNKCIQRANWILGMSTVSPERHLRYLDCKNYADEIVLFEKAKCADDMQWFNLMDKVPAKYTSYRDYCKDVLNGTEYQTADEDYTKARKVFLWNLGYHTLSEEFALGINRSMQIAMHGELHVKVFGNASWELYERGGSAYYVCRYHPDPVYNDVDSSFNKSCLRFTCLDKSNMEDERWNAHCPQFNCKKEFRRWNDECLQYTCKDKYSMWDDRCLRLFCQEKDRRWEPRCLQFTCKDKLYKWDDIRCLCINEPHHSKCKR